MKILRTTWLRICNLMNVWYFNEVFVSNEIPLREKAIAVAGRVSIVNDGNHLKASCPICLEEMCAPVYSDLKMILASHMSLWHPEDVKLLQEIMKKKKDKKKESNVPVPFFVLGLGVAAGIGFLLAFMGKNKIVQTGPHVKKNKIVVFKWK